jgi:thiamine transporter
MLVYGALSITLAFVLSYFKLFSLPLGGTVTLLSMLPIFVYAAYFGPLYGFTAAFAFALLQVVQGAYIVHPVQFILDYFVAFTCLGLASFFPKNLPLGAAVGGFARMIASTVSGAVFFGSYAADYGFSNVWAYSLAYNFLTIGVDTILCVVVVALPPVQRLFKRVFSKG